jgi:hypothetical protein
MSASACTGTDCPGCDRARRHYQAHGCLVPDCTDSHFSPAVPSADQQQRSN